MTCTYLHLPGQSWGLPFCGWHQLSHYLNTCFASQCWSRKRIHHPWLHFKVIPLWHHLENQNTFSMFSSSTADLTSFISIRQEFFCCSTLKFGKEKNNIFISQQQTWAACRPLILLSLGLHLSISIYILFHSILILEWPFKGFEASIQHTQHFFLQDEKLSFFLHKCIKYSIDKHSCTISTFAHLVSYLIWHN